MAHEVLDVDAANDAGLGRLAGIVAVVCRQRGRDGGQSLHLGLLLGRLLLARLGFRGGRGIIGLYGVLVVVHLGIELLLFVVVLLDKVVGIVLVIGLVQQVRRGPVELALLLLCRLGLLPGALLLFGFAAVVFLLFFGIIVDPTMEFERGLDPGLRIGRAYICSTHNRRNRLICRCSIRRVRFQSTTSRLFLFLLLSSLNVLCGLFITFGLLLPRPGPPILGLGNFAGSRR